MSASVSGYLIAYSAQFTEAGSETHTVDFTMLAGATVTGTVSITGGYWVLDRGGRSSDGTGNYDWVTAGGQYTIEGLDPGVSTGLRHTEVGKATLERTLKSSPSLESRQGLSTL